MTKEHVALAIIIGLVAAGGASWVPLRAQTADRYHEKLQPLIEQLIQLQQRPGLAIAVVESNRVVYANVLDMARWAIANMNHGELDGRRILRASTHEVMWKRARDLGGPPAPARPSPVGISWFLGEYRGNAMVGHSGGDTGYATDLAMLPEKKIAVVWMTNSDWPGSGVVTRAALDVALGQDPQPIRSQPDDR